MAAFPGVNRHRPRSTAWIAPGGGVLAGAAVAAWVVLMPQSVLEDRVWQSGLPGLIAAAAPPLGDTARAMLAAGGGALAAAVIWSALFLLFGAGGLFAPKPVATGVDTGIPVLRRADAHPDAPARRPMSAADLGTPLPPPAPVDAPADAPADVDADVPVMSPPPVEQPIPADLDLPLAAFHPGALPEVPREPVRPVPPLTTTAAPAAEAPAEPTEPAESEIALATEEAAELPTIESLLQRLERSTRRPLRM